MADELRQDASESPTWAEQRSMAPAAAARAGAWLRIDGRTRLVCALVAAGGLTVLGLAVWLVPDARGHGTHQQLGLAPCGMMATTGLPCATCGMTTAFAHTVRFQWWSALWAQPAGFVLALVTVAVTVFSVVAVGVGRIPNINYFSITPYRLFWAALALLLLGWAFKVVTGLVTNELPAPTNVMGFLGG